ncbi:hypothetical protein BT96DRAFT_819729, partial [Gymnopus androsaceus JB14]
LAFAIVHSTTIILPTWRTACKAHHLNVQMIPRDVSTRWNSMYDMLMVARKYSEVIDNVTSSKTLKLRKYELLEEQWGIVDDLIHIFKNATLLFSKDSESTISQVIPMMDIIDDFLIDIDTGSLSNGPPKRNLHAAVKAAVVLAKATMNCYYSQTDESNVYCIAMGMISYYYFDIC